MRIAPAAMLFLAACSPDPGPPPAPASLPASPAAVPGAAARIPSPDSGERDAAARLEALGPSPSPADLRDLLVRFPGTAASRTAAGRLRDLHGTPASPARQPQGDPDASRNAARTSFNAAAARARKLAAKGDLAAAGDALSAVSRAADPEVDAAVDRALAALRRSAVERRERHEAVMEAAAWKEADAKLAPVLASHLRERRYAEALKELDEAAARPGMAPLRDPLADERAAVAEAASFWEAFLKALAAHQGQEVSLPLSGGRRLSGRLLGIADGQVRVEGAADVPLASLHEDLVVAWTLGHAWPANDGAAHVKAALFLHADGREDAARRFLATAKELGAAADGAERIFREGLLRQVRPAVPAAAPERKKKP